MVTAVAEMRDQFEVETTPVAKRNIGLGDIGARPVRGKERISGKFIAIAGDNFAKPLGPVLLARLNDEFRVETELSRLSITASSAIRWARC